MANPRGSPTTTPTTIKEGENENQNLNKQTTNRLPLLGEIPKPERK